MFKDIIHSSKWSESHGAELDYLGMGSLYYSIPYALKSLTCVCLGSGAGFVPKLMHKAQEDLIKEGQILLSVPSVYLIDANIGPWGRPVYEDYIENYSFIKLIKKTTDEAVNDVPKINYLHVDADHSYEQVYIDLNNYGKKMSGDKWAITIHDTNNPSNGDHPPIGCYRASMDWARDNGHDIVNFQVGCGTALIMPRVGI
jgi:hypothetical protein